MSNIEKFTALVSSEKTNTIAKNRERIKNRAMLRESQNIALKVLSPAPPAGFRLPQRPRRSAFPRPDQFPPRKCLP